MSKCLASSKSSSFRTISKKSRCLKQTNKHSLAVRSNSMMHILIVRWKRSTILTGVPYLSSVELSCALSFSMTGWIPNIKNSYLRWRRNSRLSFERNKGNHDVNSVYISYNVFFIWYIYTPVNSWPLQPQHSAQHLWMTWWLSSDLLHPCSALSFCPARSKETE